MGIFSMLIRSGALRAAKNCKNSGGDHHNPGFQSSSSVRFLKLCNETFAIGLFTGHIELNGAWIATAPESCTVGIGDLRIFRLQINVHAESVGIWPV